MVIRPFCRSDAIVSKYCSVIETMFVAYEVVCATAPRIISVSRSELPQNPSTTSTPLSSPVTMLSPSDFSLRLASPTSRAVVPVRSFPSVSVII